MRRSAPQASTKDAALLTRAFFRAAQQLGLSQKDASRVLGLSPATVSRAAAGRPLAQGSKESEIALQFLRIYRSLDALVGGNADHARAWLAAENKHLGGAPGELIASITGIVRVAEYLDAMRGRL
jgi:hypothetical protein